MFDFAAVHDRHGLETAVRVLTDSTTLLRGWKYGRSRIVHQQKRAGFLRVLVGEDGADRKTVAHPMALGRRTRRKNRLERRQSGLRLSSCGLQNCHEQLHFS